MGVDRTDYLMLGLDMGVKDFDWLKFEDEVNGAKGRRFDIVYDGMSGQYCIAGKIIAKSDPSDGIEMTKIKPEELGVDRSAVAAAVAEAFGRNVQPEDFSLLLFSHFS